MFLKIFWLQTIRCLLPFDFLSYPNHNHKKTACIYKKQVELYNFLTFMYELEKGTFLI